jgi:osmoprotectant transport system permease protein
VLERAYQYALTHQDELFTAVKDHLTLTLVVLLAAVALSIPLGIAAARSRWANGILQAAYSLRVIPSLAVLFLVVPYLGLTFQSAALALLLLAVPPVLINTCSAIQGVDPFLLEAANGLGITPLQRLVRIELPLAFPVILAGIRTAAVEVIASATLAAFIGAGGLGIFVTRGLAMYDPGILLVGAIPVVLLTLAFEAALGGFERLIHG